MRTKLQAMADRLLLLYVIDVGNKAGNVDGTFKLMKIPFMSELESTRNGINTFHYSFYRWTFGPFTTEIYEDADCLSALGLSTPKEHPSVTAKGQCVLESATELFRMNSVALRFVKQASKDYAPLSFGDLKNRVYGEIVNVGRKSKSTIADAPKGLQVLCSILNPSASFVIDDDWVDTLWGYFNYSDRDLSSLSVIKPFASFEMAAQ